MGCFSSQFLSARSSKIHVTTIDGHCRKFDAPMYVQEVLVEHPDHALFHSATVRQLDSRAKPLLGTIALQPRLSYCLVPLPRRKASRLSSEPINSSEEVASAAVKQRPSSSSRRVSFAGCPSTINPSFDASTSSPVDTSTTHADASTTQLIAPASKSLRASAPMSSLQVLPSSSDGVVRVKAVITKKQLAAILAGGGDALSMVESLLTPLLKEGGNGNRSSSDLSQENSFAWRPALESIPESS